MGREIELKLALPESALRAFSRHPILATAVETRPGQRLSNIYFDTPDLDLRRHRMALRLRKQGRQWLQTVKCAGVVSGGLSSRPEWEYAYDGHAFDFSGVDDEAVRRRLEKEQRKGRLLPVFETNFLRRTWRFEPSPGSSLYLMLDKGQITSEGRSLPIIELEIEIDSGDTGPLFDLARQLAARLPLIPDARSKAERGYRLFQQTPLTAVRAADSPIQENQTPLQAFRTVALSCLAQAQGNEQGVLECDEPEFIHQMRVGLRRLRSALRTFSPLLPPEFEADIAPRLRQTANVLGDARDWDVALADIIAPTQAVFPGDERLNALAALAQAERDRCRAAARAQLKSADYGRLMLDLIIALHNPSFDAPPAEADLPQFADEALRQLRRKLKIKAKRADTGHIASLHQVRIAAKRLRYALEFFAPLLKAKLLRKELTMLAELQSSFGLLNDLATADRLFTHHAGQESTLREALALLTGWHRARHDPLHSSLPERIARLAGTGGK